MKYLPALAAVCLLFVSSVASAQQISPNPNPVGNTISVNTSDAINDVSFTNHGTINFKNYAQNPALTNKSGATLMNYGRLETLGGYINNSGTVTNKSGGVLDNVGWIANESGGMLINESGGDLRVGSKLTNKSGGTVLNDGKMENYGTLINESGGTLINTGDWEGAGGNNHGTVFNNGQWNVGGGINHGTVINNGQWDQQRAPEDGVFNLGSWTNNGTQRFLGFEEGFLYINHGTLNNIGTLILKDTAILDTSGGSFANFGTLKGDGKIKGNYTDHGHIKPGNSAGVMTIDGDYFKVDGTKEIELGGLFDGGGDKSLTEHDWLDVMGNVELAGTLDVKLLGGFELHRGNVFNFLRVGGTLNGQYDGLDDGDLVGNFGGQDLFITYGGGDGNDVALFTNAVPEPTTVLIWSMLAGVGMTVRRRR